MDVLKNMHSYEYQFYQVHAAIAWVQAGVVEAIACIMSVVHDWCLYHQSFYRRS